jgi:hypothetical protein
MSIVDGRVVLLSSSGRLRGSQVKLAKADETRSETEARAYKKQ